MGLPPLGQPPEENYYDCFYACKAAVMIKVGLGLESVVWLGLAFGIFFTIRVSYKWLFYLATVRQLKHVELSNVGDPSPTGQICSIDFDLI